MPELQTSINIAEIYAATHKEIYALLPKTIQDKIDEAKTNPNLKDPRVDEFIRRVAMCAESVAYMQERKEAEEALKKVKKVVDTPPNPS